MNYKYKILAVEKLPNQHVDGQRFATASHVIDQDDQLHPTYKK